MRLRNLRLLYIDDNSIVEHPPDGIDLVSFVGRGGVRTQIQGWLQHCNDLSTEKRLEFDLLTIDINFERDGTDPQRVLTTTGTSGGMGTNCSGLYHAMLVLARRPNVDEIGNHLPLAWEIRTVSSAQFEADLALEIEATRAYGLLRSLLAEPELGESLLESIAREHAEQFASDGNDLSDPHVMPAADRVSFVKAARWDLVNQPPIEGGGLGAAARLLRSWRMELLRRIKKGSVHVDVLSLTSQILRMEKLTEPLDFGTSLEPSLPLVGWEKNEAYGIALRSIMADVIKNGRLDMKNVLPGVRTLDGRTTTVTKWLREVAELSGLPRGAKDPASYVRLGRDVHTWALSSPTTPPPFFTDPPIRKCMVFAFMVTRSVAKPNLYPNQNVAGISTSLGLAHNDQTFRRPFNEQGLGGYDTPRQFQKALQESLAGRGSLFSAVPLLQDVLRTFCLETLSISETELHKHAPGLIDSTGHHSSTQVPST